MDYAGFVKKLALPAGSEAPRELVYDDVVAKAITREHLRDDVRGINASIELIRRTRGGRWPAEPVTEEHNYADLVWHEVEFRDATSLTYAVFTADDRYLGCCYLYPMGRRTKLTAELINYDVDVSWWVTPPAYEQGYYAKLYAALQQWMRDSFPGWRPYYSNKQIPDSP